MLAAAYEGLAGTFATLNRFVTGGGAAVTPDPWVTVGGGMSGGTAGHLVNYCFDAWRVPWNGTKRYMLQYKAKQRAGRPQVPPEIHNFCG
jgi:hypothetical protein